MKSLIYSLSIILIVFLPYSCREKKVSEIKNNNILNDSSTAISKKETTKSTVIDYDSIKWTEIIGRDIYLDIRYATTNNFVKKKMYNCPRCFLRPEVATEIMSINNSLQKQGYKLKLFDCYRPRPIQQLLWNIKPDARYVTPPSKGSMHNRGLAVDLTITDMNGNELDMGTGYDYFGVKAYHTSKNLPEKVLQNRKLLKSTMEKHGFHSIRTEWWHYSYSKRSYPLSDWIWNCK